MTGLWPDKSLKLHWFILKTNKFKAKIIFGWILKQFDCVTIYGRTMARRKPEIALVYLWILLHTHTHFTYKKCTPILHIHIFHFMVKQRLDRFIFWSCSPWKSYFNLCIITFLSVNHTLIKCQDWAQILFIYFCFFAKTLGLTFELKYVSVRILDSLWLGHNLWLDNGQTEAWDCASTAAVSRSSWSELLKNGKWKETI